MDFLLSEILLFLDPRELRLADKHYHETIDQTPYFKRDYFQDGTFQEWLKYRSSFITGSQS